MPDAMEAGGQACAQRKFHSAVKGQSLSLGVVVAKSTGAKFKCKQNAKPASVRFPLVVPDTVAKQKNRRQTAARPYQSRLRPGILVFGRRAIPHGEPWRVCRVAGHWVLPAGDPGVPGVKMADSEVRFLN